MEEDRLIKGCLRGESWAQKKIYEQYASAMMSVCQRYVGNRETARDLLHDGFVKLFTKIHAYSGTGSFAGWIRRIFVTTALEHLRRNDILRYSLDIENIDLQEDENVDVSVFEQFSSDDLFDCVASLPHGFRTVFNMYAIEGYSHAEIASLLDISESTSRSQYSRARVLLQRTLLSKIDKEVVICKLKSG